MISRAALPYFWMLIGAFTFSVMAMLAHELEGSCDWRVVATARTAVALVLATLLTLAGGARLVLLRPKMLWVRSLAGSVSLVCTFYALPRLPVSDVLTLTNVFPIWVALLSWPLLGEPPTRGTWLAIAVALSGVLLVAQPHLDLDGSSAGTARSFAAAMALTSSLSTSISMLGLHRLHQVDPRAIVVHFSGVSLVVCLVALAVLPRGALDNTTLDAETLWMLLGVGVCATVGQLFLTKAFAAGPPAKVSVVALSQVGFAMAFDTLAGQGNFSLWRLVGIALVMTPTAWLLITQGRLQTDDL